MAKRKPIIPKAPTEVERLQTERAVLQARLDIRKAYFGSMTRAEAAARLVEVKRRLNQIYAAGL